MENLQKIEWPIGINQFRRPKYQYGFKSVVKACIFEAEF